MKKFLCALLFLATTAGAASFVELPDIGPVVIMTPAEFKQVVTLLVQLRADNDGMRKEIAHLHELLDMDRT